jgi:predicted nucleotidyltransferase
MWLRSDNLKLPPVTGAAARLEGCLRALVEELPVEEIWVYGSVARGEAGPDSDVDLLLISDGPQDARTLRHQAARLLAHKQGALPLGLNVVPAAAWLKLQNDAATVFPEIKREGVRLYVRHA